MITTARQSSPCDAKYCIFNPCLPPANYCCLQPNAPCLWSHGRVPAVDMWHRCWSSWSLDTGSGQIRTEEGCNAAITPIHNNVTLQNFHIMSRPSQVRVGHVSDCIWTAQRASAAEGACDNKNPVPSAHSSCNQRAPCDRCKPLTLPIDPPV